MLIELDSTATNVSTLQLLRRKPTTKPAPSSLLPIPAPYPCPPYSSLTLM